MAKYKDGSDAAEGHEVQGVDSKGKPVKGTLVMIHRHLLGKHKEEFDIAVVQNQRLIGDLKASDFEQVKATSETPAVSTDAPK